MPSLIRWAGCRPALALLLFSAAVTAADLPYFAVLSEDPGAWPAILSSIGLQSQPAARARIFSRAGRDACLTGMECTR